MNVLILLCLMGTMLSSDSYTKSNEMVNSVNVQEEERFDLDILFGDITDEEAIEFVIDTIDYMNYFPLSHSVPGEDTYGWVYYIDSDYGKPDDFKNYFLQYMNEEVFEYLYRIFEYDIYNGYVACITESELSRYEIDSSKSREYYTINRIEKEIQIKVPFVYWGLDLQIEPKEDYGIVRLEKDSGGIWRITKISQWLNDLICYEFKDYISIYKIKNENDFKQFQKKYGENSKGETISTQIIRNGDYILPDSDKKLLTESDLQPLNKLSATLAYYEIEARHGYISEREDSFIDFQLYFINYCPWFDYSQNQSGELNHIEKENQDRLQRYMKNL